MDYIIRKAKENEKWQIAKTLTYSFKKDFSGIAKDMDKVAKVFENSFDINRLLVAELQGKIVGIIGYADNIGRPVHFTKKDCRKHLGFLRGSIAFMIFSEEFMGEHTYSETTGVIDVLGVLEEARGRGIAKALLERTVETNPQYSEFVLNVTDINSGAIRLYERFGFVEYERVPYKWANQAGFKEKIWMKYIAKKKDK